jgi:hypothetical protein
VLLPSRARPERLEASLESLEENAYQPEQIDYWVRVDDDDKLTLPHLHRLTLVAPERVHFLVGPRLQGYRSMDVFWNELARAATGDWLLCWNDDAIMATPHWDGELWRIINGMRPRPRLIAPVDDGTSYGWPAFPVVHRSIPQRLGHLTVFPSVDNWLEDVVHKPGIWPCVQTSAIHIQHQRPTRTQYAAYADQTWQESQSAMLELGPSYDLTDKDYWQDLILTDIRKLGEP